MELMKAEQGAVVAKTTAPIMGRVCTECAAFVTKLGRTEGVLCDAEQCPYPKLNHGVPVTPLEVPTVEQAEQAREEPHALCGVQSTPPRMPADTGGADVPGVRGGVGERDGVES